MTKDQLLGYDINIMINVSISELKINPSKIITEALDYPVAVQNRNKVQAYLIGKDLYEKLVLYLEDYLDRQVIKNTDFKKGKDFEKVAQELGI